jgi:hypothetical protein
VERRRMSMGRAGARPFEVARGAAIRGSNTSGLGERGFAKNVGEEKLDKRLPRRVPTPVSQARLFVSSG